MRLLLLLPIILFLPAAALAQDSLKTLFNEGIALHDKGDYEGAIRMYDEVIRRDNGFSAAYYEKSFSLYKWGKYQDCADWCKSALKKCSDEKQAENLYVNYGSALDALDKPGDAIKIYSEGIKKYPGFYLLSFNRGVTEYLHDHFDDAAADFEHSVALNPAHASSHQYLAYSIYKKNKMAAVLSLATFLLLEPEGQRAEKNLKALLQLLGSNVEKKDEKNISITLSPDAMKDKKGKEDDFHLVEMMISLNAALDYDEKFKNMPPPEKLKNKLEAFASLEGKGEKKGFFTRFYVPLLADMEKNDRLLTACYIMYTTAADGTAKKWLNDNKSKVDDLYKWLNAYRWTAE